MVYSSYPLAMRNAVVRRALVMVPLYRARRFSHVRLVIKASRAS